MSIFLLQSINLGLRFIVEICALISLGYWGFKTGQGIFLKVIAGIGSPLVVAVIWGMFGSPGAPLKVSVPIELLLEIFIYGSAALALYVSGKPSLSITFIIVAILNKILMIVWQQ